jgi:hypothetical protein
MVISSGHALPALLLRLIAAGRWKHPGVEALQVAAPFISEPLVFLETREQMEQQSGPLMGLAESENSRFSEYRGSQTVGMRGLPWMDVELSINFAINERPGDDVALALDLRTSTSDPRVIGTDWYSNPGRCMWREVAPRFSEFCRVVGLVADSAEAEEVMDGKPKA